MAESIDVVGLLGNGADLLTAAAQKAVTEADVVIGSTRQLEMAPPTARRRLVLSGRLDLLLEAVASEPGAVCVLASGDPGFFGVVRPLAERFGPAALRVHPAPSAVSLAFARLGWNWDDAAVVSAHGRPLTDAARLAARLPKVAVLVSAESPPEALGRELVALGAVHTSATVCSRLGLDDERVETVNLDLLAAGSWDPLSVVVLSIGGGVAPAPSLAWGRPETAFAHRAGMVTKGEVRAAVLGRLALPGPGTAQCVLWDVGAGSGSVAIECALLAPWVEVIALESEPDDADRLLANARAERAALRVVRGAAPAAFAGLPDPDRIFIGGGGLGVLDAALARLRPGGRVVASFAAMDRAAAAAERLGQLAQVGISRGRRLPDGGWRLEPDNPVFVVWGPTP